jgi:hypothetical protein
MAHFAQIDEDGLVTQVLVIDQATLDTGLWGSVESWVQTSYNTHGGVYYTPNTAVPDADQTKALRKNFASVGFTYDADRDAFIPPQPAGDGWVLDEFSCSWVQST